jgi:hypothetical protein
MRSYETRLPSGGCTPDGDVLTLRERLVAARHCLRKAGIHTASVTEPPVGNGG